MKKPFVLLVVLSVLGCEATSPATYEVLARRFMERQLRVDGNMDATLTVECPGNIVSDNWRACNVEVPSLHRTYSLMCERGTLGDSSMCVILGRYP